MLTAFRINHYVALKIATSESNRSGEELKILKHLSTESQEHPGKSSVMSLLDSFEHRGPNGVHECFVFEAMGPSAGSFIRSFPLESARPDSPSAGCLKHQLSEVKSILRQILHGIDFLHKNGIVYSDLQPGNILVSIENLSSNEENQVAQYDEEGAHFVKVPDPSSHERFVRTYKDDRLGDARESSPPSAKRQKTSHASDNRELDQDLKEDHKPRYLALKRSLEDVADIVSPVRVKISDMGGAFFVTSPPEMPATPINMRSPDLILGHPISQDQDTWSFGCLVFELITGRPLFNVDPFDYSEMVDSLQDEDDYAENGGDVEDDPENGDEKDDHADFGKGGKGDSEANLEWGGNTESEKNEHNETNGNDERVNPDNLQDKEDEGGISPQADADHLQQFACALRPLPNSILSQWPKASSFFSQNGEAKIADGDNVPPWYSLEVLFDREKPVDVSAAERIATLDLIREILQYEPQKRPSISQLLQHPWFATVDTEDDSGGERA